MDRALRAISAAIILSLSLPVGATVVLQGPTWTELNPQQKSILAPLSGEWDNMDATRRRKWLGIAQRFPTMKPEEQARVQQRMVEWVKLGPEERQSVRSKYKDLKKAPPEKQATVKQKWQEYEVLPNDEKQRLKQQHAQRKPRPTKTAPNTAVPFRPAIPKPTDNVLVPLAPTPRPTTVRP